MSNTTAMQNICDILKATTKVEDGLVTDNEAIIETLPEGLSEETFRASLQHVEDFTAGSALALGEMAIESGYEEVQGTFTAPNLNMAVEHSYHKTATIKDEERHNYMTSAITHTFGPESVIKQVHAQVAALVTSEEAVAEEE